MNSAATIACAAAYGSGGLGGHLAQLVEHHRAAGTLHHYLTSRCRPGDESISTAIPPGLKLLSRWTPLRYSLGWRCHLENVLFDRRAAAKLPRDINHMIAFCGQALKLLQCARKHGAQTLEVVAPTAHISHCNDQHRKALARWPLGDTWLNNAHIARALKEYAIADRIQVSSEYVRKTFLDRGVPAGKIVRFDLQANPRYVPAPEKKPDDGVFRIAYIGGLTPIKGTPLLLEAFERLSVPRKALYLVGNTGNRAAHRFVQSFTKRCSDIHIVPGDPLPVLQIADVYVHPSFQDGLGLAPLEALACGVPVIVSEDTGMKEFVHQGINGFVVPTGERDALIATLEQFARNPFRVDRKGQQK